MANEPRTMDDADLHILSDLSIYNCVRFGPYKAVIYEDQQDVREYTNFDIAREAAQLAAGLQALAIEKGDRVIVMVLNNPEVLVALLHSQRLQIPCQRSDHHTSLLPSHTE